MVAIGVHAGKFAHERETAPIADACRRLGVDHPVVNDRGFRIWRENSVAGWPTVAIVDPEGWVVGQQSGELPLEGLDDFVTKLIQEHERRGTLNRESWPLGEAPAPEEGSALRFPGSVDADIEGRVVVSDTGHHRVLVCHMLGNALEVRHEIGRGEPGFEDGPFDAAAFDEPQGLALSGDMLIVADRGNHAVRMVDLEAGQVATMAGTGELADGAIRPGDPLETPLRSPWDVLLNQYDLYIAMAGSHQIWRIDLKEGELVPHAGTGAEALEDGPVERAALAQPMALASDGSRLYFADAESSSVRAVPFEPGGEVETLIGEGLFEYGDEEGGPGEGSLQHASGLTWGQGTHRLWVADTYNHKLKTLDPRSRRLEAVEPFEEELDEPMGLASAGHLVFVADTNHHRVLRVDEVDKRVVELAFEGA